MAGTKCCPVRSAIAVPLNVFYIPCRDDRENKSRVDLGSKTSKIHFFRLLVDICIRYITMIHLFTPSAESGFRRFANARDTNKAKLTAGESDSPVLKLVPMIS